MSEKKSQNKEQWVFIIIIICLFIALQVGTTESTYARW